MRVFGEVQMQRVMVRWWRPLGLSILLAMFVVVGVRVASADDDDDARRLEESIDRKLDDMRSPIRDSGRDQTDRALDKLSDASDKARDVVSMADELRNKNVSDDHKRLGERHAEAGRAFLDAAQGLARMKSVEVKLRSAEWPRQCEDLDRKLKDAVDRIVDQKDHEGPQKIRQIAEAQAAPVRDGLRAVHAQENDFSSWYSQAERFSYSEGHWSDVRSELSDARNYTRDGWKRLLEDADRGCERVTKWEENHIVTDALRALGDKAKSKDDLRNEMMRQLDEMSRLVSGVERNSSGSEVQSAINGADAIASSIDRMKDLAGTEPGARAIVEKWPEYVRTFKEAANLLIKMKEREYLVDHAHDRCQAAEQELLDLIKDLEDKAPIDQDREEFYDEAKAAADRAAGPIKDKLDAADKYQDEIRGFFEQIRAARADDPKWTEAFKNTTASAQAILDYYKNALADAHKYCDQMTRAGNNPSVAKALRGDCDESTYKGLVQKKATICSTSRACNGSHTCDELVQRKRLNVDCYDARLDVMNTCFRGGDHKHYKALVIDAEKAIGACDELIPKKCK